MLYEVVKVFNNNVVLLKSNDEQCVLISKGIGFSKKTKDIIDISKISESKKIFYTNDNYNTKSEIRELSNNLNKLEDITREIVKYAYLDLGIKHKDIYNDLYDHLTFTTERIRSGSSVVNTFIREIKILCADEFIVAIKSAKLLSDNLSIVISESELGFLALNLYAVSNKKDIKIATTDISIYQKLNEILLQNNQKINDTFYKEFVLSVNSLISSYKYGSNILLPQAVIDAVKTNMLELFTLSEKASAMLASEFSFGFDESFTTFLAMDFNKFLYKKEYL